MGEESTIEKLFKNMDKVKTKKKIDKIIPKWSEITENLLKSQNHFFPEQSVTPGLEVGTFGTQKIFEWKCSYPLQMVHSSDALYKYRGLKY